jgi:YidC/Oxa1 family membrane protein insertase
MDRKSILILVACFVVMLLWGPLVMDRGRNTATTATNTGLASGTNAATTSTATNPMPVATSAPTNSKFIVHTDIPEQLLVISNSEAIYTFTSRGGGLQQVALLRYPGAIHARRDKKAPTNDLATLNATNVPPVFAVLGDDSLQGDGIYKLSPTPTGARAEKTLPDGLTIVKDFDLGTNYLVNVSVTFQNQSQKPLIVPSHLLAAGTTTPMYAQDNGQAEMVYWHNGSKQSPATLSYFNTNTSSWGLFTRTPLTEFTAGSNDVAWVSVQNQFFTLATMMPRKPAQSVFVHMVPLSLPSAEEIAENPATIRNPMGLQTTLLYPGVQVEPGRSVTNQFTLFAGPKEYQTLAAVAARFNNDLDLIMNFGWAGFISKTLLAAMNWVHDSFGLGYGLVIILITVFIKLLFWPLTQASTRSAKRMQALQPQLKALQDKYKDDPQKATAKQWEFYKKNKISPLSGCLPMLLQVPVFIGFYGMLRNAIELRGASFLWIADLSKPDTVFGLTLPFHFLGMSDGFLPINPMPLIMGCTQLLQASMAPMSPGMDPAQQKMMRFMPLMMLAFMYNMYSGLVLYWTVSNLLTILQTKLTKTQPAGAVTPELSKPAVSVAPQKKKK